MTSNSALVDRGERPTFDYIVVGAGPAGCAVAARLAQSSGAVSVALLEAGAGHGLTSLRRAARHRRARTHALASQLRLRNGSAVRLRRPEGLPAARAGPGRLEPHQRDDLQASRRITIPGSRSAARGGAGPKCCPTSTLGRQLSRRRRMARRPGGPLHVSDFSYRNPAVEAFIAAAIQAGFRRNDDFNGDSTGRRTTRSL